MRTRRIEVLLSVVIDNFQILGPAVAPHEADTPLIVDPDAVLARPIAPQGLKPIPGRRAQIAQIDGGIEHIEFA
jgi:hypothetical protein